MLDQAARRITGPALDRAARTIAATGVRPTTLTAIGWLAGVGACVSVATGAWTLGLVLWLLNRLFDGLDGAVARQVGPTDLGGFLDIVADFSIYSGFVLAIAIQVPEARLACVALLVAYYLSGTAFLALSSILERRRADQHQDGRSLRFVGGLAEGTETVIAYTLFTIFPEHAELIAWAFAGAVTITVLQRVAEGVLTLASDRVLASRP
ncbi:CDP-alcohol phosphatidyltransferase [Aeromicrobium sp. A1-2]|uniref:CDP-alcohol phosphatidyltransferase family protein n=1 Tax=Aeromicrobium sp. A1-2 TaxID=2107713 RepID=UPI000E54ED74|nr:CDP-alcohol phosphatidyltransferase family protein [Aeromicrobium sp. A1-2]AXT86284.1 CDP-alcohol phosphatidyltransferase [Aeromicrobium sp. A1-2]